MKHKAPREEQTMGTGTGAAIDTNEVAEKRTVTRMGTGTVTRMSTIKAKERQKIARNRTRVIDSIRHS